MKIPAALYVLATVAVLGSGCAATEGKQQPQTSEANEQPEYRTGSNIPKHYSRPKTQEERDRAAQEAEEAKRDAEKILRPGT